MNNNINLEQISKDQKVRKELALKSHYWFFHIYFSHYVKHSTADFQKEMFNITEAKNIRTAVIVSFRGSAKSTIMSLSFPIWAILGLLQKKFVVIAGMTQDQAKLLLSNIRRELETNELLRKDFGEIFSQNTEWNANSIVIPHYDARIMATSPNDSIRGVKHKQYRPDLVICDDVEDMNSVKTKEGRDKIYQWFNGEIIPIGDLTTKIIVIGNLLHQDSLIMRLKNKISNNSADSVFREYPLINDNNEILWNGKYPNMESVEIEKSHIDNIAWNREYLLKILPDTDAVIDPEWIHYYDPEKEIPYDFKYLVHSVDLAISERDTADYTAIISARIYADKEGKPRIYILPFPFNKRVSFPDAYGTIKELYYETLQDNRTIKIFVEDVGYQRAIIQQLENDGITVEGIKVTTDKRSRLSQTTAMIKNKQVLFPNKGAEILINQLLGFGVEKHDDLVDAFSMLVSKISTENFKYSGPISVDLGGTFIELATGISQKSGYKYINGEARYFLGDEDF